MISDLSSFIEFMAAIYVTMSIDNLIARRFWTRDYESMLGALFLKWRVPYISDATSNEKDSIGDLQKTEEQLSRRRGVLLLSLCIFLLIYLGFEPNVDVMSLEDVAYTYFSLVITFVFVLCAFIFDQWFMRNGWMVLFSVLFIPFIFLVCESLKHLIVFSKTSDSVVSLLSYAPAYTVFVLLFPILWQLIRNWLYSRKNIVRIQYLIRDELQYLDLARSYTKGSDINSIKECYRNDAVQKVSISGTEDSVDGNMIQTFNGLLREIIKTPRVRDIIPFIGKKPLEPIPISSTTVDYSESVANTFDDLCDQYYKIQQKPSIVDFAKSKKVDHKAFKEYYNKWIIRNSKG